MKKNGMVALLLMGSISMYGQTTSKMTLSGRVKGFTDTPTLICDLSDRKSTRLNSSHVALSRMPSSA